MLAASLPRAVTALTLPSPPVRSESGSSSQLRLSENDSAASTRFSLSSNSSERDPDVMISVCAARTSAEARDRDVSSRARHVLDALNLGVRLVLQRLLDKVGQLSVSLCVLFGFQTLHLLRFACT